MRRAPRSSCRRRLLASASLVLALVGMVPTPLSAYHFFQLKSGATYLPVKWGTLGVRLWVDTEAGFLAEMQSALDTWNDVPTAQNVFGASRLMPVNMTGANLNVVWGTITGDGVYEVVFDADGSALAALGLDPATVNGYGPTRRELVGGQARITDAYLVICGTRNDFDRRATEVHELGHILGLAHSAAGMYNSGEFPSDALDVMNVASVPTMHPFSVGGAARRTLEADDIAAISQLYPEASFATTFGTLSGTVTRCGGTDAVQGVSVRAVNTANASIQVSRYSGFDGNTRGSFEIRGLPPGSYRVIVESLGANDVTPDRMALVTAADGEFATEYYDPPQEKDCTEELPDAAVAQAVAANATTPNVNFKVIGVKLAFVVDDTDSMGREIASVRTMLSRTITTISDLRARLGQPFPHIAVITFKDDVTKQIVSNDPARLQAVVGGLAPVAGDDCPESSNAALMVAGRLLSRNGRAMLFTDADSRPDGPARVAVEALLNSKGATLSTLLSGTCTGELGQVVEPAVAEMNPLFSSNARDEYPAPATLGIESAVRTFSEISLETGGFFTAIPGIKGYSTDEQLRYEYTGTNIAVSSEIPTVGLVSPGDGPRGATMNVELRGLGTNFVAASTVVFHGGAITVNSKTVQSPTRLVANITIDSLAPRGFYDVTVNSPLGSGTVEAATGHGAFNVVSAPSVPTIVGTSPPLGAQGERLDVTVSGIATHFAEGRSAVSFGRGVTLNDLTIVNETTAVADITIHEDAVIGYRDVAIMTGTELATESMIGPFLVTAPPPARPRVVAVAPEEGALGQTVTVSITGENTAFVDGSSVVSFSGAGLTVTSSSVQSLTTATAVVEITPGAELGFRDVVVTTGGEVAALLGGFRVVDAGTGPGGVSRRYLAEGCTGGFFDMRIAMLNPNDDAADVSLRFQRTDGVVIPWSVVVPGRTRRTLDPEAIAGLGAAEFSTLVESSRPIVVDRTMTWDDRAYGSHAETAVAGPASTWYLAEGATHSGFDLFYLVQNPNAADVTLEVRYLLPSPRLPIVKTYDVKGNSRFNIWVNLEDRALAATDVSAVLSTLEGLPVIVERAMYLSLHRRVFDAGHESIGVTAPATAWFLAEGATGRFFDLFILVANPTDVDADVEAKYLLPGGDVIIRRYTVGGSSRFNIWVDAEGGRLEDTAVSTTVTSMNDVPIIVERSMWWPYSYLDWQEAHNSAGATNTGTSWALADGESGGDAGCETYILIANTSGFAGRARVELLFENGPPSSRIVELPANSRTNIPIDSDFPEAYGRRFGAIVESLGTTPAQLVVERAMYTNALGASWVAGTNAVGTRLK